MGALPLAMWLLGVHWINQLTISIYKLKWILRYILSILLYLMLSVTVFDQKLSNEKITPICHGKPFRM